MMIVKPMADDGEDYDCDGGDDHTYADSALYAIVSSYASTR